MREWWLTRTSPLRLSAIAVGFGAYFLYIWLHVRLDFHFYSIDVFGVSFPIFSTSRQFLSDALSYPGGLANYLSAFLSQSYASAWLGALVTTTLAAAVTLTLGLLARRQGGYSGLLAWGPALLSLVMAQRYVIAVPMLLDLTLVMVASLAFLRFLRCPLRWGAGAIPLTYAAVYYVSGWGVILFSVVSVIGAIRFRKLVPLVCGLGLLFTVFPVLQLTVLSEDPSQTYGRILHLSNRGMLADLPDLAGAGWVVATLLLTPALGALFSHCLYRSWPNRGIIAVGWTIGALTAVVALWASYEPWRRSTVESEYLLRTDSWNAIRDRVERLRLNKLTPFDRFDLNLALLHQGKMSSEMLRYPQNSNMLMLPVPEPAFVFPTVLRKVRLSFELGNFNQARVLLYEWYEVSATDYPYVLNALAECHLVIGENAAARRYYARLTHDLAYGQHAKTMLKRLDDGIAYGGDERLIRAAARLVDCDIATSDRFMRQTGQRSYDQDSSNRLAQEHWANTCLLNGDLRSFHRYLSSSRQFGEHALPLHWQEALLLCQEVGGIDDSRIAGLVGPRVQTQFARFAQSYAQIAQRSTGPDQANAAASRLMRQQFGTTYFFYYAFHESGEERWYQ